MEGLRPGPGASGTSPPQAFRHPPGVPGPRRATCR